MLLQTWKKKSGFWGWPCLSSSAKRWSCLARPATPSFRGRADPARLQRQSRAQAEETEHETNSPATKSACPSPYHHVPQHAMRFLLQHLHKSSQIEVSTTHHNLSSIHVKGAHISNLDSSTSNTRLHCESSALHYYSLGDAPWGTI